MQGSARSRANFMAFSGVAVGQTPRKRGAGIGAPSAPGRSGVPPVGRAFPEPAFPSSVFRFAEPPPRALFDLQIEPNRNPCGKISWSDRNRMPNRNRMPTSVPSSRLHPTPPSFVLAGSHPPSYTLIERQNAYPVNTPIPCRPRRNATHYGVTV